MLRTGSCVVDLTPADLPRVRDLCRRDPAVNAFVEHRAESTGLDRGRLGGAVWGYLRDGELVAACHAGANLVPVQADRAAVEAFSARAAPDVRGCSSLVGPAAAVLSMWEQLEPSWGPAREVREEQPFLVLDGDARVAPDPQVRPLDARHLDLLYPASVAMFVEELGMSPDPEGRGHYRARTAQLLARGWCFARVEEGRVVFKAEVVLATPTVCQVQGVYVDPTRRGQGLAAPAMAAVVTMARAAIAPMVSLYVNAGNVPARRAYERVGFRPLTTFATVLL